MPNSSLRAFMKYISNAHVVDSILLQCLYLVSAIITFQIHATPFYSGPTKRSQYWDAWNAKTILPEKHFCICIPIMTTPDDDWTDQCYGGDQGYEAKQGWLSMCFFYWEIWSMPEHVTLMFAKFWNDFHLCGICFFFFFSEWIPFIRILRDFIEMDWNCDSFRIVSAQVWAIDKNGKKLRLFA